MKTKPVARAALFMMSGFLSGGAASAQETVNGSPSVPLFDEVQNTFKGIWAGIRDFFALMVIPNWRYILAAVVVFLIMKYLNGRVQTPRRRR